MAERSPILGYNHNIRHRGLIFHVQTEDSGVQNPHLFTHMFWGGVIISSRKMVYDASQAEDAVKGLMQAQHKAMLKDLKGGNFDAKIDEYLGDTEGLEPPIGQRQARDTVVEEIAELEAAPVEAEAVPREALSDPTIPVMQPLTGADFPAPGAPEMPTPENLLDDQVTPPAGSSLSEALLNRAGSDSVVPPPSSPSGPPGRRDDVSAAFRAIRSPEKEPGAVSFHERPDLQTTPTVAGPLESRPQAVDAEPQSPAAIPEPVDHTRSGAYAVYRPRAPDRIEPVADPGSSPSRKAHELPPPPPPPARHRQPAQGKGHPPNPTARPVSPTAPPVTPTAPPVAPTAPPVARPSRGRAAVIVSRPSVIVGGPSQVVGGKTANRQAAPPPRRAREEPSRPNLFGKDLISEKSLDEVILAYLSDDSKEE